MDEGHRGKTRNSCLEDGSLRKRAGNGVQEGVTLPAVVMQAAWQPTASLRPAWRVWRSRYCPTIGPKRATATGETKPAIATVLKPPA